MYNSSYSHDHLDVDDWGGDYVYASDCAAGQYTYVNMICTRCHINFDSRGGQ